MSVEKYSAGVELYPQCGGNSEIQTFISLAINCKNRKYEKNPFNWISKWAISAPNLSLCFSVKCEENNSRPVFSWYYSNRFSPGTSSLVCCDSWFLMKEFRSTFSQIEPPASWLAAITEQAADKLILSIKLWLSARIPDLQSWQLSGVPATQSENLNLNSTIHYDEWEVSHLQRRWGE